MAFAAQSLRNVELKNNQVEFVKKNYKGNWEALKNHKDVKNWSEQNKLSGNFNKNEPVDCKLMSILDDKLQTKLRYLKLQKIIENKYELGDNYKIRTEFCILKSKEE